MNDRDEPELETFRWNLAIWLEKAQIQVRADAKIDREYNGALVKLLKNESLATISWKSLPEEAIDLYSRAKATLNCVDKMLARELARVEAEAADRVLDFLIARAGRNR